MNDPYAELYQILRQAGREGAKPGALRIRLGTVLSASPLKVEVAGTVQEADRFYIAARLCPGWAEPVRLEGVPVGNVAVQAACAAGSHSQMELTGGTLTMTGTATRTGPALNPKDLVLLLTDDDQIFYLVDKVVQR